MKVRTNSQLKGYKIMANSFEIDIPMKDHPMAVIVKPRDDANNANVFDLYYCDQLCGCMFMRRRANTTFGS
jgi:hypothetical protein